MRQNLLFALLLVILLCASTSVQGADLPCFLHQVNRSVDSGAAVTITGMPAGTGCQYGLDAELVVVALEYQLQRQTPTGEFATISWPRASYPLMGNRNRRSMLTLNGLVDGQYRLITVNNGEFLEAVHFTVGGGVDINHLNLDVPYVQAMAVVHGGYLYVRAHLGKGSVANGYLYQGTEMLPAEFFMVDQQDAGLFVNQSFIRGGTLDMPWVRVKLQNNNLDPTRSVSACLTTDGGGATACFGVYDPNSPMKLVTNGFVASSSK